MYENNLTISLDFYLIGVGGDRSGSGNLLKQLFDTKSKKIFKGKN